MNNKLIFLKSVVVLTFFISCSKDKNNTLFQLHKPESTNVHFSNTITENDTLNILEFEYVYNGGGVGIADFNNDSLPDIFFSGNMVSNKIYLNKGGFSFEDITGKAGVTANDRWSSGVVLVDINHDGWMDIYVCNTVKGKAIERENQLFINNGLNHEGVPVFSEKAGEYGINDSGHSTHAAFFDYDLDSDLDLYILTNQMQTKRPNQYHKKVVDGSNPNTDRLYRNNGDGTFSNISEEAGILTEGYGLGISVQDYNLDGWPDIYITNDYLTNDLLYINQKNGTFKDELTAYTQHQSYSAMGHDAADINNDGYVDIFALDMLPRNNTRKRLMISGGNYLTYIYNDKFDYSFQYIRNTLQLNNGPTPKGHPTFSEIGQLSNIYETDWSWSALFADIDMDGYRDLLISNGFPKDVTDHDFGNYRQSTSSILTPKEELLKMIPEVKIANYAFKNNGDLTFSDMTKDWGISIPSFSNGAAFGDLDNDGDLDYVVNNINDSAFIFENTIISNSEKTEENKANYLKVKLKGNAPNTGGLNSKISIHYNGRKQFYEHYPYRGYISTVQDIIHFGVGEARRIDSIQVKWSDGSYQLLKNIAVNQLIAIDQAEAGFQNNNYFKESLFPVYSEKLMNETHEKYNIYHYAKEQDKIDFNMQRTLPQKYTQNGPGIAVGDINNDGLEDFFIGGAAGYSGEFYVQQQNGAFSAENRFLDQKTPYEEDMGTLFFDADSDGDLDLYVVSGSYEYEPNTKDYQDRLYFNDGQGYFKYEPGALPQFFTSGSCVKAADYDQDGDLDLFIGGRVHPGGYPKAVDSYILENNQGEFSDVTEKVCPDLQSLGMVTDALWTDFNNDQRFDLIVTGEWLPVQFFKNTGSTFINVTMESGIADYKGWWNSVTAGDFDHDGDMDYILGNLGQNHNYKATFEYPLQLFARDFDNSGTMDPIIVRYDKNEAGEMVQYPWHARDDLTNQLTMIKKRTLNYETYGKSTIHDLFSKEELKDASILEANYFNTCYIENLFDKGKTTFHIHELPVEAQFAPVYGIQVEDIDSDGFPDIVMVGNNHGAEIFTGKYDAFNGLVLKGHGNGKFTSLPSSRSGFYVPGDAKGLVKLITRDDHLMLIATQNQDSTRVFASNKKCRNIFHPQKNDAWVLVEFINGNKMKVELYYGNTYLSHSSRKVSLNEDVKRIRVYDYKGKERPMEMVAGYSF